MMDYLHWIRVGLLSVVLPLFGEGSIPLNTSNPYKLDEKSIPLNTSNPYKLAEYRDLFSHHGLRVSSTHYDLPEIDAEPIKVVRHKASQVEVGIWVDDTSLEVEGELNIGVNVRWLQHLLKDCVGKRATWRVLLAQRQDDGHVYIYEGCVEGHIVDPCGENGYSFDPYFVPDGSDKTLAQERSEEVSARARAVHKLVNNEEPDFIEDAIEDWQGDWQHDVLELVAG